MSQLTLMCRTLRGTVFSVPFFGDDSTCFWGRLYLFLGTIAPFFGDDRFSEIRTFAQVDKAFLPSVISPICTVCTVCTVPALPPFFEAGGALCYQ